MYKLSGTQHQQKNPDDTQNSIISNEKRLYFYLFSEFDNWVKFNHL